MNKKMTCNLWRVLQNIIIFIFLICILSPRAWADFEQELRDQIASIQRQYEPVKNFDYFREMGVVARKADDAELNDLTVEIVGKLMIGKMEIFINKKLSEIEGLYNDDAVLASRRLQELFRTYRFYEPSEDFLRTTGGQALAGKVARARGVALKNLSSTCNMTNLNFGFQALHLTGLFTTHQPEEVRQTRDISQLLDCCIGWKPTLTINHSEPFDSDYDSGTITQEAKLSLRTNTHDFKEARWEGDWIYKFKAREGIAEGRSHARVTYHRGSDLLDLFITPAKISSSGRINMPVSLAGESRQAEMGEFFILPRSFIFANEATSLTGCRDERDPGAASS